MRARFLVPVLVAVCLACTAAAQAGVTPLGWREQAKVATKPVIRFHVQALVTRTKGKLAGWAVTAEVTNTSSKTLRIRADQFGLALFSNGKSTSARDAKLMPAAAFDPALPAVLGPGKTWRGTFAGLGIPPNGAYVRVLFGWFSGPAVGGTGFNWLSDHVHHFCNGACSTFGA
jgi:hypothetical protein